MWTRWNQASQFQAHWLLNKKEEPTSKAGPETEKT